MKEASLFTIPIWTKKVEDFESKKKKLVDQFDKFEDIRDRSNNFLTNRNVSIPNHDTRLVRIDRFSIIMEDELNELYRIVRKKWGATNVWFKDVWSVTYKTNDYQNIHTHGSAGLTGILYLDIPDDGPNLKIVQPWSNWVTDTTDSVNLKLKEGEMIVFPSFLLHSSEPNRSSKIKRVISWDMGVNSKTTMGADPVGQII